MSPGEYTPGSRDESRRVYSGSRRYPKGGYPGSRRYPKGGHPGSRDESRRCYSGSRDESRRLFRLAEVSLGGYRVRVVLPGVHHPTVPWVHPAVPAWCTSLLPCGPRCTCSGRPSCQRPPCPSAGKRAWLPYPAQSCPCSSRVTNREDREE